MRCTPGLYRKIDMEQVTLGSISLWQTELKESGEALSNNPLQGIHETDVAVVGAGITGAATALWLARAGAQVRVLEALCIAAGASGRNGGVISDRTTASYPTITKRHGRGRARRLCAFTLPSH